MMDGVRTNSPNIRLIIAENFSIFNVDNVYSFALKAALNKVKGIGSIIVEDNELFWYVAEA